MLSATKTRKQYRNKKMRKKALKSAYKRALNMNKNECEIHSKVIVSKDYYDLKKFG